MAQRVEGHDPFDLVDVLLALHAAPVPTSKQSKTSSKSGSGAAFVTGNPVYFKLEQLVKQNCSDSHSNDTLADLS